MKIIYDLKFIGQPAKNHFEVTDLNFPTGNHDFSDAGGEPIW